MVKKFLFALCLFAAWPSQASAATSYASPMMLSVSYSTATTYSYAYVQFGNSSLSIPNNAYLEYDVYIPLDSADFNGGLEMGTNPSGALPAMTNLRDYKAPVTLLYARDQNFLRPHPFSDLSNYAKGQWYHRKFDMGSAAGRTVNSLVLSTDTGNDSANGSPANYAGWYNAYFDNIKFTNAYGVTLTTMYQNASSLPMGGTSSTTAWPGGGSLSVDTSTEQINIATGLNFSASPSSVAANGATDITVTVQLTGPGGAIPYTRISLASSRLQDTLTPTSGVSNASGSFKAYIRSTLAGSSVISAAAGPFNGTTSVQFTPGAPTKFAFNSTGPVPVVPTTAAPMVLQARDAFDNATLTSRSAWVHTAANDNLELSLDGVSGWVPTQAGLTLTPSAGPVTVYIHSIGGVYPRVTTLLATDTVGAGALTQASQSLNVNNAVATTLAITAPAAGTAGALINVTLTAMAGATPAFSNASVALSSLSVGEFSLDAGNSWASTASLNLADGVATFLYRDKRSGSSTLKAVGTGLSSPTATITIGASTPALISGGANPNALNLAPSNNVSTLSATVTDIYGNACAGAWVSFTAGAGQGNITQSAVAAATNAAGIAAIAVTYTSNSTSDPGVYIRAETAGVKPTIVSLSLSATNPSLLNLSPAPSTTGVNITTSMTVLAQDSNGVTGYSNHVVRLTSPSSNLFFSPNGSTGWANTLDVTLSGGRSDFYYRSTVQTSNTGVTVTATDQNASPLTAGNAIVYIPRASLNVQSIIQPYGNVSRSETAIPLTITVTNTGGTDAWLTAASCFPTFSAGSYTATFWAGNSLTVAAGATVSLFFTVDVAAGATLGSVSIDGQVGGVDSDTGSALNDSGAVTTSSWVVADPATPQINVYRSNGTPGVGVPFSVTVVAVDAGGRTITTQAAGITLSTRLVAAVGSTGTGNVNLLYPQLTRGVAVFSDSYDKAEGIFLKAFNGALVGNSLGITPTVGALAKYRVYYPSTVTAGTAFSMTITPVDQYGNTRTGAASVSLTATLSSLAGNGTGAFGVTTTSTAGGASILTQSYTQSGVYYLVATDGSFNSLTTESQTLTVVPAPLSKYSILNPSTGVSGVFFAVTVTAMDAYGNTRSGASALTLTVNGGAGTLSRTWLNLGSGQAWLTDETYDQAGTIKLFASDGGITSVLAQTTAIVFTVPTATPSFTPTPTPTSSVTPSISPTNTFTMTSTISPTPTFTSTVTPTFTRTSTISPTFTDTSTISPTDTQTSTVSPTDTQTSTISPTDTQTSTVSPTDTQTSTISPTDTQTSTVSPTDTQTSTISPTDTQTPTVTPTFTPTSTISPTDTQTSTVTPTFTPTSTISPTDTQTSTVSPTDTPTSTISPTDTQTSTVSPTDTETSTISPTDTQTSTVTPTETPTSTISPTDTHTHTVTPTFSPTLTETPTETSTSSVTPTFSDTETSTETPTATETSTSTASPTATETSTSTATPTASPTATDTATSTSTSTITVTSTATPPWTATATPTVTPTATQTATLTVTDTPVFAHSGTDHTVLAPGLLRSGDLLRLYFAERPASCRVQVYTLDGGLIAVIETGPAQQPVFDPAKLASGVYVLVVETRFDSGHYEHFRSKVAVVH